MPDSRSSTEWCLRFACALLLLTAAAGCATVRPEEKEYLAEPAMTWSHGGIAQEHEDHVVDNREGSFGATNARAGGCGCN